MCQHQAGGDKSQKIGYRHTEPAAVFIALLAVVTSLVGTERHLAQYACIRSFGFYHRLPDAGTSY